jgi:hypothetical protein
MTSPMSQEGGGIGSVTAETIAVTLSLALRPIR